MNLELRHKTIVVTGSGRGIGKNIALHCARLGADVVLAARSENQLRETAREIESQTGACVLTVACDVSIPAQVHRLFQLTQSKFGAPYGLICAAAIYGPIGPLETNNLQEWQQAFAINFFGTVSCVQASLPLMKEAGGGRIILFSGGGQGAMANFSCYASSKGAIWRFTETVAAEIAPHGIYLNAIAPGAVNTQFLEDLLSAGPEKVGSQAYAKALEQKRTGGVSGDHAADLVAYLLSEKSKGLTGKILSAVWDRYQDITEPFRLSETELYTVRRVVTPSGGTRYE